GLDVRDDRDLRRVRQEGRVALVGLDDEDVAGALVGAGAGSGEIAADRERGVEPAVLQRHGEHRRGGGLARGAGDGGQPAPTGERGQRGGAVLDGEAALAGGGELGVALPDRGGHHDGGGRLGQVRGVVAQVHLRAQRAERQHGGRLPGVGAGDPLPPGQQDAGDAAHPRAADADEVDGHAASPPVFLRVLPTSRTRWASRSAASACPERRAAAPVAASRAGSVSSGTSSASTRSPVSSASGTSTPPPAATTGAALSACSPLPCGSGTYTAGSPTADTSATVIAPHRPSTASAAA